MTFPITDAQVERAFRQAVKNPADMRGILEAALDRRVGDKDRRKVRNFDACFAQGRALSRELESGRRRDDKPWTKLPLAEPPIPVSEGMIKAAHEVTLDNNAWLGLPCEKLAELYRAMEAKRIEEQKAQPPQSVIDTIMGSLKPFLAEKWAGNSQIAWQVFGDLVRRGDLVFKDAPCGAAVQHSHLRSSDINFESCLRHPLGPPRRTHRRKGDPK